MVVALAGVVLVITTMMTMLSVVLVVVVDDDDDDGTGGATQNTFFHVSSRVFPTIHRDALKYLVIDSSCKNL